MPTKEWANWSIFKDPGPFNVRHFAKYGRHDDELDVDFNKVGAGPIPRRLLPNVDKAIKVLEESDLRAARYRPDNDQRRGNASQRRRSFLTQDEREFRKNGVRRAVGETDFVKRYEKAQPSAAAEKKRFLKRAKDTRQAAKVVAEVMHELPESSHAPIAEIVANARQQAGAWERMAAACVVQRHKPKPSQSKEFAVVTAWWLLTEFRKWHPGVTRGGPWQTLASILYDGQRRSIGIEYLQRKHDEMCDLQRKHDEWCEKSEKARATAEQAKSKT
jgi:hypothetical protein